MPLLRHDKHCNAPPACPPTDRTSSNNALLTAAASSVCYSGRGWRRPAAAAPAAPAQGSSCLLQFVTHVNKFLCAGRFYLYKLGNRSLVPMPK
jgi:hypothetical protein